MFDIVEGPEGDVLLPSVRRRLYRLIRHEMCLGVWFGFPCGTFSRARRWKAGMPGALRGGDRALYWLPNLSEKDALNVKVASELLQHMKSFCLYAHRQRIPFYIKNPLTSRLWRMPEIC